MDPFFWSMILVALGFAVVALELFVPSAGMLGVVAAILFISGIITGFFHSLQTGAVLLLITTLCLPLLFVLLVKVWPNTPIGRRVLIGQVSAEDVLPKGESYNREELIGKKGFAKTKMLPSGMIKIGDRSYDAVSDGFAIEAGDPIKVVAIKMSRIMVQPFDPETEAGDFEDDDVLSRPIEDLGIDPIDNPLG
jgi:membrane-bound serine protease (ClpP class)